MPFGYYSRLTRAQQAVYRKSDAVTEVRLPGADLFQPLIEDLAQALGSESRAATQEASGRLIGGLARVLGLPPVRVEVLAARPHARWGELHGLYTAEPGRMPRIQLWMRTAKQRRVVAFRTYLRTLLHEVGHHIDYTLLRMPDSFHTEGFYKRESSLFHQLVPEARLPDGDRTTARRREEESPMPTMEDYARTPTAVRIARLKRTPDDLAAALKGHTDAELSRRPDPKNWAAKEVLCHLRDTEEFFQGRFEMILAMDDVKLPGANPDRWAEERQYLRNDAGEALAALRKRRGETLALLDTLGPEQWKRAGTHAVRGRMTLDDFLTLLAWHDDNHLDQLQRALQGRA
jgi:hypothetical protein